MTFSKDQLAEVESKIFSNLKTPYKTFYVPIVLGGTEERIWTISLNTKSKNTPLVLVHGFAAGIGLWCLNLDYLSQNRPVYAMDVIGFARSSRYKFEKDSENEEIIINSIEKWRKYLKLESFFLLGHSLGGYLATSYTLSYPNSVKLLILCDAWGFSDQFDSAALWIKSLNFLFKLIHFNPMVYLRMLGRFGPSYIRLTRGDILDHYKDFVKDHSVVPTYIYQCNADPNATGEIAFYTMVEGMGWTAKIPMIQRISSLKKEIPLTIMFGSDTWMDKDVGRRIREMRSHSLVDVQIVPNSAHHIYADQAETFNKIVKDACDSAEEKKFLN